MGILSEDTDPAVEARQIELLRHVPVWRKMQMVGDLNRTVRDLARIGLRKRYPRAGEQELRCRLAYLFLGASLARKVYGPLPEEIETHVP